MAKREKAESPTLAQQALVVLVETTIERQRGKGRELTPADVVAAIPQMFADLTAGQKGGR